VGGRVGEGDTEPAGHPVGEGASTVAASRPLAGSAMASAQNSGALVSPTRPRPLRHYQPTGRGGIVAEAGPRRHRGAVA
jgi:hypothetical protein